MITPGLTPAPATFTIVPQKAFAGFAPVPTEPKASMPKWLAQTSLVSDITVWYVMKLAIEVMVLRGSYRLAVGQPVVTVSPVWQVVQKVPLLRECQQKLATIIAHRHEHLTRFIRSFLGFMDGWVLYDAGLRYQQARSGQEPSAQTFNDRVLDILITERVEILLIKLFEVFNTLPKPTTVDERFLQKARCLIQETSGSLFAGLMVLWLSLKTALATRPLTGMTSTNNNH